MKALRRFTVRPQLPPPLQPLGALIRNLRWSWHPASQDLFADIDRELWARFEGDPLKLLGAVSVSRLEELAADEAFLARMHGLAADLDHYLHRPPLVPAPGQPIGATLPAAIAYFSMEFGVTEALPNYSGGLGILAGDHLKSASDLGVPIIGVGLLYRFGYFWQSLSSDGWQQEHYPAHDPQGLPIDRVLGADGEQLTDQRADARRPAADRADLVRPGRPGAAAAAGRGQRGQRRLPARHHRPALRRRPGPPDQAGDPARHRRGAGGATPTRRRPGTRCPRSST